MKGKTKTQKGITLIALIITIVVLLILAAVAISSITNDNILGYAENATKEYNQAVENEQDMMGQYVNYLNGHTGSSNGSSDSEDVVTGTGPWTQSGTTVTDGTITLAVGDYVNYVSGVSGYTDANGWQVIGIENGQILLMSSYNVVGSHELNGAEDYLNGVTELNSLCTDYGKGTYATGARSVNVDDINRVTGYDPETANYGSGNVYQYGNKVTYTLADGKVAYASTVKSDTSANTSFTMPDGKVLGTDMDSVELTSDSYTYKASSYLTDTSSNAYKLIFGSDDTYYWLGSSFLDTLNGFAGFGMRWVQIGRVDKYSLWYSNSGPSSIDRPVRAVVSLESAVKLTSAGSNSWTLSK